jgi:pilus assembly protein CpaB
MDRRKVLLVVAGVIAALGTLLVFLYVRGADTRADQRYDAVQVLRVVKQIDPGETVDAAQAAGKIETSSVSQKDLLPGALSSTDAVAGKVAVTAIYPGEQLVGSKFGATGSTSGLTIPKGKLAMSVNLTDPARVAGFVNPGDKVAIFMNGTEGGGTFSRLLLPEVQVIGAGTTTVVASTTTDDAGAQTTDQLPKTLLTVAVSQPEAERLLYATSNGDLAFALLTKDSEVAPSKGVTSSNLFR